MSDLTRQLLCRERTPATSRRWATGLADVLAAAKDDRIGALVSLDGLVRYFPAGAQKARYAVPERLALPVLYVGGKPSAAEWMYRVDQGEKFLDAHRPRVAVDILVLTTGLYPHSGRALYYLAMAYDKQGDTALAIQACQRVLGFWPDPVEAKQNISRLSTK